MSLLKSVINSILLVISIVISKIIFRVFGQYLNQSSIMLWFTIIIIFFVLSLIFEWSISNRKQEHSNNYKINL